MWLTTRNHSSRYPSRSLWNDHFFDEFFSNKRDASYLPSVDIRDTEDALELSVEVPGVSKEDIDISVKDGVLTIKGEKKNEVKEEQKNYYRVERTYGSFQRSFHLADEVNSDEVSASLENGVLTLSLPKAEKQKEKQITIN